MGRYDILLLALLCQLNENTERIASALEKKFPTDKIVINASTPVIPANACKSSTPEERKALADTIKEILIQQIQNGSSQNLYN